MTKLPTVPLDTKASRAEFDVWITPSLGEIRDTERFREEMISIVDIFEVLGLATDNFADIKHCNPTAIANTVADSIKDMEWLTAASHLKALAAVLFLVTGKSDNNVKCQLPLYLREKGHGLPAIRGINLPVRRTGESPPRVLEAEKYMKIVARISQPDWQCQFLEVFIRFVLSDDLCVAQLWSIGRSYFMLKPLGRERDLLSPLVAFQVRGSVSASGGHNPEALLRTRLSEWGLIAGVDYNTSDVVLANLLGIQVPNKLKDKTRAYDFGSLRWSVVS